MRAVIYNLLLLDCDGTAVYRALEKTYSLMSGRFAVMCVWRDSIPRQLERTILSSFEGPTFPRHVFSTRSLYGLSSRGSSSSFSRGRLNFEIFDLLIDPTEWTVVLRLLSVRILEFSLNCC